MYYLQSMNANAKVTEDNKVKITGLTRRVDSLGRIVIPKELRRMLHIKEGSPLEIYMDADETIVLKKYSQVGSLKNISQAYAQSLSKVTGATVCVADRDEIIAAAGKDHKKYIGKALSKELEDIMDKRKSALYSKKDDNLISVVKDDEADCEAQAIAAIVHDGDSAGAVILCAYAEQGDKLEIVEKLVSAAAEFPARQLG